MLQGNTHKRPLPYKSGVILLVLLILSIAVPALGTENPSAINLAAVSMPPSAEHYLGTDMLGRDIFAAIFHGARISLFIGVAATLLSAAIAFIYGTFSAFAPAWLDNAMMRLTDIILSIPTLLAAIFLQAILGEPGIWTLSLVLGLVSWCTIAKLVRVEVLQLRHSEYILAARLMGAGFFHILRVHVLPNVFATTMFMLVMNVRSAIVAESTLSFMGLGLPLDTISLGSLLTLSERALLSHAWWIFIFPGFFLILLLMSLTELGEYLRGELNHKERYLP